jgi:hypothetical protein
MHPSKKGRSLIPVRRDQHFRIGARKERSPQHRCDAISTAGDCEEAVISILKSKMRGLN